MVDIAQRAVESQEGIERRLSEVTGRLSEVSGRVGNLERILEETE